MKTCKVLAALSRKSLSNSPLSFGLFCVLYMPQVDGQQRATQAVFNTTFGSPCMVSSIVSGDVLWFILRPCMNSRLMWLTFKVIFAFFFSGKQMLRLVLLFLFKWMRKQVQRLKRS